MSDAVTVWLHLLGVALWIGPQVFLFAAAIPAVRTVEDAQARVTALRVLTTRLGWLSWGAMLLIVLTGISNLFQVGADAPFDLGDFGYRWGRLFAEKMVFVGVAVVLSLIHTFVVGPRQLALMEQAASDPAQLRQVRMLSIMLSSITLLASIGALYMGAVLENHE
jgi:uncharacterized membrane protein